MAFRILVFTIIAIAMSLLASAVIGVALVNLDTSVATEQELEMSRVLGRNVHIGLFAFALIVQTFLFSRIKRSFVAKLVWSIVGTFEHAIRAFASYTILFGFLNANLFEVRRIFAAGSERVSQSTQDVSGFLKSLGEQFLVFISSVLQSIDWTLVWSNIPGALWDLFLAFGPVLASIYVVAKAKDSGPQGLTAIVESKLHRDTQTV